MEPKYTSPGTKPGGEGAHLALTRLQREDGIGLYRALHGGLLIPARHLLPDAASLLRRSRCHGTCWDPARHCV
jgi:hypothetical protein